MSRRPMTREERKEAAWRELREGFADAVFQAGRDTARFMLVLIAVMFFIAGAITLLAEYG